MRVQSDTQLVGYQGWRLRVRPAASSPARLLLLIHGWTGDENSMWLFARHMPGDYLILAPRAPHATRPSGFSWRVAQPGSDAGPTLEALRTAAEGLIALVGAYGQEHGAEAPRFSAMGFSQGAVMAGALTLLYPERISRVALLAGFLPPGVETLASPHLLEGKPVFIAHGSKDEMVDIERGREAARLFESAGARVTLCEDEVGHKVSADCLRGLEAFFA